MRTVLSILFVLSSFALFSQSIGDTIIIPTINYSQTNSPNGRDTMIDFPDDPNQTYEKILMMYNMRCKDGLVSNQSNTNQGCGEWDYSCHTYIYDSTRVDSVISYTSSHQITNFSDTLFNYVDYPIYNYFQYNQQEVIINSTISEIISTVGSGNIQLPYVLSTAGNSAKSQFLYTQSELTSAGLQSGEIDAIEIEVTSTAAMAQYLRVKMKPTAKPELDNGSPDTSAFTEVYFYNHNFIPGINRIQFYTPFIWDGSSNILVEFSFTNNMPDDALLIAGESTNQTMGIAAANTYCLNNISGKIDIPSDPFAIISEELTVSFWTFGNAELLPKNTSVIYGTDSAVKRSLNVHLPWSNSSIYFDCGNTGNNYDRINKGASAEEFRGSWSHWTFTKNAISGGMNIYHNGDLWHTGADKTRLIEIHNLFFGSDLNGNNVYTGKMDELIIWDKELDQQTIQDWMLKPIDPSHPDYANLLAYYKLDEGNGTTLNDASLNAEITSIDGYMYWKYERGNNINRGFSLCPERPNIGFVQGDYNLTVNGTIVTDSVLIDPNIVREYEIVYNWGSMKDDSIAEVSVQELWELQYQYTYNPEGIAIDSVLPLETGNIAITELTYYKRYPAKFQLMSFVTPYGIYLDLGMEGKTWIFDVSDYAPILKGKKRLTMEMGGQRQEDIDIKFVYVIGTPTRDVIDINPIWRPESKSYSAIQSGRVFETRNVKMHPDGDAFKVISVITGHGQEGEFIQRHHTLNIDGGDIEYDWIVWTECSTIPIYPQGGTWIYDRAGWCPGDPSDVYQYDITEHVTAGQSHSFDYNVTYASGTSNYLVNKQLVTYGAPNFGLDVAVVRVLKPNTRDASQERFNPACTYPEIVIQNNGTTTINSLNIAYSVIGGTVETYSWSGDLEYLEMDTLILPIPELTFWLSGGNRFTVTINNVNGQQDEYSHNNTFTSVFDHIDLYPENELINIELKTNNTGYQSSWILYDGEGNIHAERDNCQSNTIYNDEFLLDPGCYKLRINDTGGNGLDFWHQPSQGTGYFKLEDADGTALYTFDPDFGGFAIYEFGIGNIVEIDEIDNPFVLSVYPNPTTSKLNVKVKGYGNERVSITLINSLMSTVLAKEWSVTAEDFNTEIDMSQLPSGMYFLHFNYGSHTKVEKVIKL